MIRLREDSASVLLQILMNNIIGDGAPATGDTAKISIYDGVRPARPEDALSSNNLLAEISAHTSNGGTEHWTPVFDANGKMAQLIISGQFLTMATGTASWFRLYSEEGVAIFDGDVSDFTGTGELKLSTTNIVTGIFMKVTSATITIPYEH